MYDESSNGQIVGYYEVLVDDELPDTQTEIYYKTNALMMLVNEEIGWYERPWYIKYIWFIVIGVIIIVGVIVVIILAQRKQDIGRKLPKLVKGLVED